MRRNNIIILFTLLSLIFQANGLSLAAEERQSNIKYAVVLANSVNIRAGAGLNFEVLGQLYRGAALVVIAEKFGWYKIKLPEQALSFVHKDYLSESVVKANKLRVRAGRGINFNVIGILKKGERVIILEEQEDWLRIMPTESCYGWVKVEFLKLTQKKPISKPITRPKVKITPSLQGRKQVSGKLDELGKIINRCGTHKLITEKQGIYYLRSNLLDLNDFVHRMVWISGIFQEVRGYKYPVIDVEQIKVISW